jgi:hypothetical protein
MKQKVASCGRIENAVLDLKRPSELFCQPHCIDQRSEIPEQHRVVGWIGGKLYTVIFEVRHDGVGEYYHLVMLWKATAEERRLYETSS